MSRAAQRSSRTHAQGWRAAWAFPGTGVWIAAALIVAWSLSARLLWGDDRMWAAYRGGSMVPLAVDAGDWWRLVTAGVLHLDLKHLLVNTLAIALVGRLAQRIFGGGRALLVFAVGSVAGCAASLLTPDGWSLGASAGVFALLGALLSGLFRIRHDTPRSWRLRAQRQVLPWALFLIAVTFSHLPQTDHLAHLGALVTGLIAGTFLGTIPTGAERASRPVRVGLAIAGVVGGAAAWLGSHAATPQPLAERVVDGVSIAAPANWVIGPAVAPCPASLTDGLRFLCGVTFPADWPEAAVRARFEAAGYRVTPVAEAMGDWAVHALIRERAEHQFGRLCLRHTAEGWTGLMLRSPARSVHLPRSGCALTAPGERVGGSPGTGGALARSSMGRVRRQNLLDDAQP